MQVDADLASARTLPSEWYTSETFGQQDFAMFNKSWNLAGPTFLVKNEGDFFTFKAGAENGILVNRGGGEIRGLVNVCRHRAGPVADGCGKARLFQCRYHGWTYDLSGNLVGTPEFQGVKDFIKEDHSLPSFKTEKLGPFVFVSLGAAIPFQEFCGTLPENLKDFWSEDLELFATKDYAVDCNWKVYVDNYLEGYHLPMVHKGLFAELNYAQYRTEVSQWYSEQRAPAKDTAALYGGEKNPEARYFWLFPNTMLNIYQGLIQTNTVLPVSTSRCLVRFQWYAGAQALQERRSRIDEMLNFSDVIQEEDRLICEKVQENLNSSTYSQGRYSVKRENGVHHFHQLLRKAVTLL